MRKVNYIAIILFMLLGSGCETEPIIFSGPYFVRFTETSLSTKESNSKPILIEVHQAGNALDEDLNITYKISGNARAGIDYTIAGEAGRVTIKKGEYTGTISVSLINNANNIIRSQDLILTIESSSAGERKIGQGESNIGSMFTLTIIDDCILGGTYIGQRNSVNQAGITITSSDCETYLLSNWNVNLFDSDAPMDLIFIDNGDNTLTIPEQEEENIVEEFATIEGTGVVDPLTRVIIMTITLVDFEGQPQVTITYLPD
jgi:hypothetical protein